MPVALQIAEDLAGGSRQAIAATKRTLNHWVRAAGPIFESSLALEMLGFFSEDAREGLDAMREKRRPKFPSSLGAQA
jgi:enoyl-CoA hydratase